MKYLLKSVWHLSPVVIFFIALALIREEILMMFLSVAIFAVYVHLTGFKKREATLFIFGLAAGFLVEVVLGAVHREQFWARASLFGVPVWLPVVWGMGFVIIRRLGDVLVMHRKNP